MVAPVSQSKVPFCKGCLHIVGGPERGAPGEHMCHGLVVGGGFSKSNPHPRRERQKQIKCGIARQGEAWWLVCHPGHYSSHEGLPGSTWKNAGQRGPGGAAASGPVIRLLDRQWQRMFLCHECFCKVWRYWTSWKKFMNDLGSSKSKKV